MPSQPTTPGECYKCGIRDTGPIPLYPLSIYRHWREGGREGRMRGRSIGPIRLCRSCVVELLKRKELRAPGSSPRLSIEEIPIASGG